MSDPSAMTLGHFQALSKQSLLSKKRVFERAAEAMGAALNLSSETIYRALLAREKLGSTAIGEGIAIPHCRINECSEAAGCLVTLQEPIDYGSADGQDVDIIFVLLVPEEATEAHLKLLAALARSFSNAEVRDRVRQTQDPEALKQLLLSGDAA
ncbi:MAG: PTS sugar transporter subunit IIA [Luminiphilus sp.]